MKGKRERDVSALIKLLTDLKNEMFSDLRVYEEAFRLIENPWAWTTANVEKLAIFGYEARDLKNELIDLQKDTELKTMFEDISLIQ